MCKIWVVNLISRMIAHEHNSKCWPGKIVFPRLLHMTLRDITWRRVTTNHPVMKAVSDTSSMQIMTQTARHGYGELTNTRTIDWAIIVEQTNAECMNKESWSVSLQFIHFMSKTPFPSQFSNINITITARHSLQSVAIYCHLLSIYALLSILLRAK